MNPVRPAVAAFAVAREKYNDNVLRAHKDWAAFETITNSEVAVMVLEAALAHPVLVGVEPVVVNKNDKTYEPEGAIRIRVPVTEGVVNARHLLVTDLEKAAEVIREETQWHLLATPGVLDVVLAAVKTKEATLVILEARETTQGVCVDVTAKIGGHMVEMHVQRFRALSGRMEIIADLARAPSTYSVLHDAVSTANLSSSEGRTDLDTIFAGIAALKREPAAPTLVKTDSTCG